MSDSALDRLRERAQQRAFAGRSEAYRWLRRRHTAMAALFEEFQPTWAEVAAEMAAAGITGGRGKSLTPDAVRRIWKTVCRDVTEVSQCRADKPKMPPGWAPIPVAILPPPESIKPPAAPAEPPPPRPIPTIRPSPSRRHEESAAVRSPEEVQAEIDGMKELLKGDRSWLPGQKRS
jgi:hypothetical protein